MRPSRRRKESFVPRHAYSARREPPSLIDKILFHPFELSLAATWVFAGLVLLGELVFEDFTPSRSLENPWIGAVLVLAVLFISGGVLIARGLLHDHANIDTDWQVERWGLLAVGIGSLGYSTAVLWAYPTSILGWSIPMFLALPCGLRIFATFSEEHYRRRLVDQMKTEGLGA